ncbi:MotA/TolQ/ExbB proton channel family protein [Thauera sp.]
MQGHQLIDFFFANTDALGATLFGFLVLMSLASWYCIVAKSIVMLRLWQSGRRFRARFWSAEAPGSVGGQDPFARLAAGSLAVHAGLTQASGGDPGELLLRSMQRIVGEEGARLDSGQTLLASVAALAPFVGLFGTVWGVHHALIAIGLEGSASLDRIAGPVGEALVMTALGLAVAIPALLAYNVFSRSSQMILAGLDAFAHELHHYLITGRVLPLVRQGA